MSMWRVAVATPPQCYQPHPAILNTIKSFSSVPVCCESVRLLFLLCETILSHPSKDGMVFLGSFLKNIGVCLFPFHKWRWCWIFISWNLFNIHVTSSHCMTALYFQMGFLSFREVFCSVRAKISHINEIKSNATGNRHYAFALISIKPMCHQYLINNK